MQKIKRAFLGSALILAGATAQADTRFGVGAIVGTTGYGAQLTYTLSDKTFNLRIPLSGFSVNENTNSSGVEYDVDADIGYQGLVGDWYPFSGAFRITFGAFNNTTDVEGNATPTSNVQVGDNTYTPGQIGTLTVTAEYKNSVAPYLGIGWGNTASDTSGIFYTVDIGAIFTGKMETKVTSTGSISQADLGAEADEIQKDLEDLDWWPVLAAGIGYRF